MVSERENAKTQRTLDYFTKKKAYVKERQYVKEILSSLLGTFGCSFSWCILDHDSMSLCTDNFFLSKHVNTKCF